MDARTTAYIEFLNIMTMDTLTSATSIADSTHVVEPLQAIGAGPDLDFHQDHAISSADFTHMVGGAKFKLPKRPPKHQQYIPQSVPQDPHPWPPLGHQPTTHENEPSANLIPHSY